MGLVEYVFSRGMYTAAWMVACYKLLTGGDVGRTALGIALREGWMGLPCTLWLLRRYLKDGVGPLVWRSAACATRGRPGLLMLLLGIVGAVMAVLKYRSTFYIALEISGVFVFFGFIMAGLGVLGSEFWGDPLGLARSTARAKQRGDCARRRQREC
jgi:hypothetical protein